MKAEIRAFILKNKQNIKKIPLESCGFCNGRHRGTVFTEKECERRIRATQRSKSYMRNRFVHADRPGGYSSLNIAHPKGGRESALQRIAMHRSPSVIFDHTVDTSIERMLTFGMPWNKP